MVLVSHEDLMTCHDYMSWEINESKPVTEDPSKSFCQRVWDILNSKTANTIIVLVTIIEALIILAELLINLRIIQDPYTPSLHQCNCGSINVVNTSGDDIGRQQASTLSSSSSPSTSKSSQNLQIAKEIIAYTSITLLALFLFEILLRILTGKRKYLRQAAEVCDGVVVVVAFSLDFAFLIAPNGNGDHWNGMESSSSSSPSSSSSSSSSTLSTENVQQSRGSTVADGKVAAIFIILLRLWRISRLAQSIVQDAKRDMGHIINAYKRDKIQAEHKVEILILKVEDLEHESAYLKEKIKKIERDALAHKKRSKGRELNGCFSGLDSSLHSLTNPDSAPWRSSLVPVLSLTSLANSLTPCATPPPPPAAPPTTTINSATQTPMATSPACPTKSPRKRRRKSQDVAEIKEFSGVTVDRILQSASIELDTLQDGLEAAVRGTSHRGTRRGRRTAVEQHDSGRGSSYTPGSTPRVNTLRRNDSTYSRCQSPLYTSPSGKPATDNGEPDELESEKSHITDRQLDEISEIERVKKIEFLPQEGSKDVPVTAL